MVDLVIIAFALTAIFLLLPNVLSFHAKDRHASSIIPNNLGVLAKAPSQAGAPARVVNLLSYSN